MKKRMTSERLQAVGIDQPRLTSMFDALPEFVAGSPGCGVKSGVIPSAAISALFDGGNPNLGSWVTTNDGQKDSNIDHDIPFVNVNKESSPRKIYEAIMAHFSGDPLNRPNATIESEVTCEIVVTRADGTVEPAIMARAVRSRSRWAILCDLCRHVASQLREAITRWKDDSDNDF